MRPSSPSTIERGIQCPACSMPSAEPVTGIVNIASVEWRYPLAAQPVVCLCRLAFQPKAQTASGPGVGCGDAPAFAPLRQPKLFVRIVAAAEGDLARTVFGQSALDHLHGEERPERQIVEPPVMR